MNHITPTTDIDSLRRRALANIRRLLQQFHPDKNGHADANGQTRFLLQMKQHIESGGGLTVAECRKLLAELEDK